jgi:hypothetical protein
MGKRVGVAAVLVLLLVLAAASGRRFLAGGGAVDTGPAPPAPSPAALRGAEAPPEKTPAAAPPEAGSMDDESGEIPPEQRWWEGHIREVRARVLAAEDGAPLAGATVELTPNGETPRDAATGADGTVHFKDLPEVHFDLVARAPGRVRGTASVSQSDVGGHGEMAEDGALVFRLAKGVVLEGVVLAAADRTPVAGARVSAFPGGELRGEGDREYVVAGKDDVLGVVSTDIDGRFRSAPVPEGKVVSLVVLHPRFREGEWVGRSASGANSGKPVEVLLEAGASVTGSVVGPDGKPCAGATVWAVPRTWMEFQEEEDSGLIRYPAGNRRGDALSRDAGVSAVSAGDGSFSVDGLAPAELHRVYASAGEGLRSALVEVTTPAAGGVAAGELRLLRLSKVFVRAVGPDDRPLPAAEVELAPASGPWPEEGEDDLDEEGRYPFEEVLPGDYRVVVRAPDLAVAEVPVRVEEGRDAEVVVSLGRGLAIEGVLVNDAGGPVPGAHIYVYRLAGDGSDPDEYDPHDKHRESKTAEEGRFRVEGLREGWYSLSFTAPDDGMVSLPRVRAPLVGARAVVPRSAEAVARIVLPAGEELRQGMSVEVTTHHGGGGYSSGGGESSEVDGVLRVRKIRPGRTELTLRPPGWAPASREFTAAPGQVVDLGEIALSRGVTLSGRVVDAAAKPVAGAKVGPSWFVPGPAVTDAEGRFRLEHLAEGEMRIDVEAGGYPRALVTVTVREGMPETVVPLARGGLVRGRVTWEGSPRARPTTLCLRLPGVGKYDPHPEAFSGAKGAYEVRAAAGKYRVTWYCDGREGPAGEVEIAEGSEQTLDVKIPAK